MRGYRRWRCAAEGCGWAGLLPLQRAPPMAARARGAQTPGRQPLQRVVTLARRARWGLAMAFGVVLVAAAASWLMRPVAPPSVLVGTHVVHRGTHLDGERLPPDHPLHQLLPAPAMETEPLGYTETGQRPLRVRRHCAWGLPGRNPYRGAPEQALRTATLSPTVVRLIAADIRAGRRVDRVQIRNDGVRAARSGREFDPARVAMTYGMTLCVDTRINFVAGHTEGGDLYEAMDDDGRIYAVMVPDICSNVSVLGQRYVRAPAPTSAASGAAPADARPWLRLPPEQRLRELPWGLRYADRLDARETGPSDGAGRPISAPGTLALVSVALAALGLASRFRR